MASLALACPLAWRIEYVGAVWEPSSSEFCWARISIGRDLAVAGLIYGGRTDDLIATGRDDPQLYARVFLGFFAAVSGGWVVGYLAVSSVMSIVS